MPTDTSSLPVILSGLTALDSLLVATATISRRSKAWDAAEKLQKIVLDGDPENDKKSLLQRVKETEEVSAQNSQQLRWVKRALTAHGSDEIVIAEAVKAFVEKHAKTEAEAIVRAAFAEYFQAMQQAPAHPPQPPHPAPPQHPVAPQHPAQPLLTPHLGIPAYQPRKSIPREDPSDEIDPYGRKKR